MSVQVDFHDLSTINPQEAVARIKEKTLVTITVQRGSNPHSNRQGVDPEGDNHVYDEILYTDCLSQNLSQGLSQGHSQGFDENLPGGGGGGGGMAFNHLPLKNKPGKNHSEDKGQRLRLQQQLSSSSLQLQHVRDRTMGGKQGKAPRERGSKDSGLSSGSSVHQDDMDPSQGKHNLGGPHGGEGPLLHRLCRTSSGGSGSYLPEQQVSSVHCRIEGDLEVEVSLLLVYEIQIFFRSNCWLYSLLSYRTICLWTRFYLPIYLFFLISCKYGFLFID